MNPISKTNWEGTGVQPGIKAFANESLEVAKKMAAEQIEEGQPHSKWLQKALSRRQPRQTAAEKQGAARTICGRQRTPDR